mmetsp:Transcript_12711/g.22870  ORF Transcript_12711/g.22870 Transcript_12711/m.22870 type:complete len:345 (-) Transcript_12711:1582-2616(-)|eukprot:CAMPEP_0182445612 /NCGR_PEP_ID=MMETSP1172-20130603/3679_1 /TAXON_ID=708627 /ORGANISM="Timspurckia oligopyrenoides, Strain CCMP3278" /LENGTH=344 /DNA_ID=CAMNT_0024641415 /DNA_START=104 /DNA_END=1138 /DNA_ORIENTATION=+
MADVMSPESPDVVGTPDVVGASGPDMGEATDMAQIVLDEATQAKVLEHLTKIEEQQILLEAELQRKHDEEMMQLKKRMEKLELEIEARKKEAEEERANAIAAASAPVVMSVNTDAVDVAADTAFDSLEVSKARAEQAKMVSRNAQADKLAAEEAAAAATSAAVAANSAEETLELLRDYVEKRRNPPIERIEREKPKDPIDYNNIKKVAKFDLGTIEAVMRSHPSVKSALAWIVDDASGAGDKVVHCAVVPRKGARLSVEWMKLHAQTMLPVMQVPKKIFVLDALPPSREEAAKMEDLEAAFVKPKPTRLFVRAPQWKYSPPQPEENIPADAKKKRKQAKQAAKK